MKKKRKENASKQTSQQKNTSLFLGHDSHEAKLRQQGQMICHHECFYKRE